MKFLIVNYYPGQIHEANGIENGSFSIANGNKELMSYLKALKEMSIKKEDIMVFNMDDKEDISSIFETV